MQFEDKKLFLILIDFKGISFTVISFVLILAIKYYEILLKIVKGTKTEIYF
jgi:hypothetical protein